MTISSPPRPDPAALCRERFGREVLFVQPMGMGRNSRVFHVTLAAAAGEAAEHVVLKFYRRDAGDPRDRLATEFGALEFLWQNGVRAIPRAIAADRDRYCAMYEYITGDAPETGSATGSATVSDIDASVQFLSDLKDLRGTRGSAALGAASEACFSLEAVAGSVASRVDRLRTSDRGGDGRLLHRWLDGTFDPLYADVLAWCRAEAVRSNIPFDAELGADRRTLSPSDFGLHNAIRRPDGSLAFVDFEYFGWDDPAKTLVDFVLHPGMLVPSNLAREFVTRFRSAFADVDQLVDRARVVYPLFGLKWCTIVLNDFLPERRAAGGVSGADASDARRRQLAKAEAIVDRISLEYRDHPLLA
jgi:hypothetical protein